MTTPPHGCISYCSSPCLYFAYSSSSTSSACHLYFPFSHGVCLFLPMSFTHGVCLSFPTSHLHALFSYSSSICCIHFAFPTTSSCEFPCLFSSWRLHMTFPLLFAFLFGLHMALSFTDPLATYPPLSPPASPRISPPSPCSSFLPNLLYFPPPPTCYLPCHLLLFRRHLRQVNVLSSLDNTRIDLRAPPPMHSPTYRPLSASCLPGYSPLSSTHSQRVISQLSLSLHLLLMSGVFNELIFQSVSSHVSL